jgi:hypothetical protein
MARLLSRPVSQWAVLARGAASIVAFVFAFIGTAPSAHAAGGWRVCAQEGGTCSMPERGVVRYGTDGLWSSRTMSGNVDCSNQQFGDPAPQSRKRCEVREYGTSSGGGGGGGWTYCAAEGETCSFRGSAEVRFGADRHYTTRRAYNSVRCDVHDFGDPIYGVTKHCEVRADAALSGDNRPEPGANWNDSNSGGQWRWCANAGQLCGIAGRGEVRYGDGRRWATRQLQGNIACGNKTFGDPAYGELKHCELRAANFAGFGDSGPTVGGWTACAEEGGRCDIEGGRVQVRFGTNGRYVYRDAYGSLNCTIETFGRDPYYGQRKQCETRR